MLEIEGQDITSLEWRYYQLYMHIFLRYEAFVTVNLPSKFNLNLNDITSIRAFMSSLNSDSNLYGEYMAAKLGYNWMF